MAKSTKLEEQRQGLEKLAKLKAQIAEMDITKQSKEIDALRKKVIELTESLAKMGVQADRLDIFFEAFVRGNAQINEINTSISDRLLSNINKLSSAADPALEKFLTPIENLKTGADNVIQLLQNTVKTATDLEAYTISSRRENTREFVEENAQLTQNLVKAYENLIKNEANLGTSKFQTLNVEKEIANTLLQIDSLDKKRSDLAGGYYGKLRMQATTILEMLNDLNQIHQTQSANNDLAKQAINDAKAEKEAAEERARIEKEILDTRNAQKLLWDKELDAMAKKAQMMRRADAIAAFMQLPTEAELDRQAKEYLDAERKIEEDAKKAHQKAIDDRIAADDKYLEKSRKTFYENMITQIYFEEQTFNEIQKRLLELGKTRQKEFEAEMRRLQKEREEHEKLERKRQSDINKRYLNELKFNSKILEEQQKKEKELLDKTTSFLDTIIGKLPGGGLLTMVGKLGVTFQILAAIVGSIVALVLRWDNITANIAEKLSITRAAATDTAKAAGVFAAQMNLTNIKSEQVLDALISMSDGLGGIDLAKPFRDGNQTAERLVASGSLLADTFGLTGQEIAGMTDAATAMGVSLSSSTIMAVNMSRGIMSAQKLMQSLANLSPKILTGFKGSNAELIGMVTKMKLLGVEANSLISSNDKLLDIENSISNAFEAQVATGANINIDKLMALQLSGNYQGVINEQLRTLQQAGYLNMSALGQELLASGMGLDRETASQMMLRKILVDKVGLTDELIQKRMKEGKLLEDDIKLAEKQGRITKLEADQLKKISEEYDNKTLQEKFLREVKEAATALSSSLKDLTEVLRKLMNMISGMSTGITGALFGLGAVGTGIASTVAGLTIAATLGYGIKSGIGVVKNMGTMYKSLASRGYFGSSLANMANSTTGTTTGTTLNAASKFGKFGKFLSSNKGLGVLGALGAGFDFYSNMQSGQSVSEAGTRTLLSSGLGIGGAMLGSLIPVPVVGTLAGGALGSMIGTGIGNLIYGESLSGEDAATQAERIRAKQQQLGITSLSSGGQGAMTVSNSDLFGAINTMSSKLDTTNNLLNNISNKPSEVSVELDGEKVGKAVMNYTSAAIDRGRTVGNSYGGNRDQNATRAPR